MANERVMVQDSPVSKRNTEKTTELEKEIEELEKAQKEAAERSLEEFEQEPKTPTDDKTKEPKEDSTEDDLTGSKESDAEPETQEEKTWKKRYGDLRSHTDKKIKELSDKLETLTDSLEKKEDKVVEVPENIQELKAWKEKNPDSFRVVESLAKQIASQEVSKLTEEVNSLKSKDQESEKDKRLSAIKSAHPDFDKLTEDDSFHDWVESEPQWVQDAMYKNADVKSAIRVIDMYKLDTGKAKAPNLDKEKEKEAAKAVDVKSTTPTDLETEPKKIRESEVNRMTIDEYAAREEEIDEAQRSGNFIYDMSGGAR